MSPLAPVSKNFPSGKKKGRIEVFLDSVVH